MDSTSIICSGVGGRAEGTGKMKVRRLESVAPLSDSRINGNGAEGLDLEVEALEDSIVDRISPLSMGELFVT